MSVCARATNSPRTPTPPSPHYLNPLNIKGLEESKARGVRVCGWYVKRGEEEEEEEKEEEEEVEKCFVGVSELRWCSQ